MESPLGRPIRQLPVRPGDRAVIPGDIHFPLEDPRAMALLLEACRVLRPTHLILQGDTFDYWGLSGYRKEAQRYWESGRVEEEAQAGRSYLTDLAKLAPVRLIGPGNHEDRWYDLVDDTPALAGMEWWWPVRDVLAAAGFETLPRKYRIKMGPLIVEHGDQLLGLERGGGKHPAAVCVGNYPGQNTLFGHTHRIDQFTRPTEKDGVLVHHGAWTIGYLADPARAGVFLDGGHRWEQGFAVVDFFELDRGKSGVGFVVNQARILRGKRNQAVTNVLGHTFRS